MKALVTGGAGYIGSHTVRALCERGHYVVVLDDLSSGHADAIDPRAVLVDAPFRDVRNLDHLQSVATANRFDVVIHFAGKIRADESVRLPGTYWETNVTASLALLNALTYGYKKIPIVFSSSAAVYGKPTFERGRYPRLTEEHPTLPVSPYGDTKLAVERAIASFGRAYELPWITLRCFNAAGADVEAKLSERHRPETHLIPILLDVAAGECAPFTLNGTDFPTADGTCVRDFVHVSDLADAHVLAAERLLSLGSAGSGVFNLGSGQGHSVLDVIDTVSGVTERSISVVHGARREGDLSVLVADPSRAESMLGWRRKRSELRTIVRDAWLARKTP